MCTAISDCKTQLFGRTLDLERSYGEFVAITPRNLPISFIHRSGLPTHLAFIGTAHIESATALYYEAVNEAGLFGAGLSFPENAVYFEKKIGNLNLASFELIPYILATCHSTEEAKSHLERVNITNDSFSPSLPTTPLHWIFADKGSAITVEQTKDGLKIYSNPLGVMTNNPPFPFHTYNVASYMRLSAENAENLLAPESPLAAYSNGLGAFGLPGDFSSASRFVRAVFLKNHTKAIAKNEKRSAQREADVMKMMHIMDTLSVPLGASQTREGMPVSTVYTSVLDGADGTFYFKTYSSASIRSVKMGKAEKESNTLFIYPMNDGEGIKRRYARSLADYAKP